MNRYIHIPRPGFLPALTQTFDDIDQFEETIKFTELKFTQLTPGRFNASVSGLATQSVTVVHTSISSKLYVEGNKSTEMMRFFMITNPDSYVISHGSLLDYNYLFGFDLTRNSSSVLTSDAKVGHIHIPQKTLSTYINKMQRDDLNPKFFQRNFIRPCPKKIRQFQRYFQQILYLLNTNSEFLGHLQTQTFLEEDLIPLLIDTLQPSEKPCKPLRRYQRAQIVKKAQEYMADHIDSPLTLKDLCDAVGSSSRAVMYGFQDLFGMSPMSYLKVQRLNGVRRALQQADPNDMVLRIASYWGFWSMGHFSRDYKQMFGESPSETLRQEY